MSELFPEGWARHRHATYDPAGFEIHHILTRTCQRCGALVSLIDRHTDWHASVDTAATTQLRGTK